MYTCDVNLEGKMLNARFIIILKGFLAVRNQLVRGSGPLKMIHKEKMSCIRKLRRNSSKTCTFWIHINLFIS